VWIEPIERSKAIACDAAAASQALYDVFQYAVRFKAIV